jgi:hypothetical protein
VSAGSDRCVWRTLTTFRTTHVACTCAPSCECSVAANYGVTVADLMAWNGVLDKLAFYPGQVLRLTPPQAALDIANKRR